MRFRVILLILLGMAVYGCNLTRNIQTHELVSERLHRWNSSAEAALLADLKGDGQEILITSHLENSHGYLLLSSLNGKSISQINMSPFRLLNLNSIKDPEDSRPWLFFSANDGSKLILTGAKYDWQVPVKREMRYFEAFERDDYLIGVDAYVWAASYTPKFLEDIDGDGKPELVCLAVDGFSANPRGVVAFDWETGKRKWYFRAPVNFNQIHFADFDGNGTREFLLSNFAFNNYTGEINGLNDYSGHLVILSQKGELIHKHKVFEGLGTLIVNVYDVNQDDLPEIFAVAATRGTTTRSDYILRLKYENGRLIREKELVVPKSISQVPTVDFLQRMDSSSQYHLVISDSERGILVYDTDLNEVEVYPRPRVKRILDIGSLRSKGKKEIIALNDENEIQVFDNRMNELSSIRLPLQNRTIFSAKIIQNNQGDHPLLAVIMDNTLVAYSLQPISTTTLLYRLVKAHALWIAGILLVMFIIGVLSALHNKREIVNLMNQLQEGAIVVKGKDRIVSANKAALALAIDHDPTSNLNSLKEIFPELHKIILNMIRTQIQQEDAEVDVSGKTLRVHIRQTHTFLRRWMIFIYPPKEATASETLEWAEIARRLSHHVRRHITNVILALDPLNQKADNNAKEYLEIIKSEIEKVRVFTHAFQRFTEMHNYTLKLQDLIPSVEHALAEIKLPDQVKVIRNYGLKSIYARIEPIRFEEAIVNTINNATEAMPQGGTLHISIREFPRHKSPRGNLGVLVEIEDTGKGIPKKYMEDIWKPFFTTNQSGTGIGIPETSKIIDSMGGFMDIQSEEGVGTTVSLWLKGEHDE